MELKQTPSQTIGPFFAFSLIPKGYGYEYPGIAGNVLATDATSGENIRLQGHVFDGEGAVVDDAMIEIWQTDANGHYVHPLGYSAAAEASEEFTGFGRTGTGANNANRYIFDTIKPGTAVDGQAPHINMIVFMRGLLSHVYTRTYFSDNAVENANDNVLSRVPADRRSTLIAQRTESPAGIIYDFNIRMQGERETVFFDV